MKQQIKQAEIKAHQMGMAGYLFNKESLHELIQTACREQREKDLKYLNVNIYQIHAQGREAEECEKIRNTPLVITGLEPK